MKYTKENFVEVIKEIASKYTSSDPNHWTQDNPLWGHCAVVALLAQDYFGGDLVKGSLKEYEKYSCLKSHFWNRLPTGEEIDFTKEQFKDISIMNLVGEVRSRESVLSYPDTLKRYNFLKKKLIEK